MLIKILKKLRTNIKNIQVNLVKMGVNKKKNKMFFLFYDIKNKKNIYNYISIYKNIKYVLFTIIFFIVYLLIPNMFINNNYLLYLIVISIIALTHLTFLKKYLTNVSSIIYKYLLIIYILFLLILLNYDWKVAGLQYIFSISFITPIYFGLNSFSIYLLGLSIFVIISCFFIQEQKKDLKEKKIRYIKLLQILIIVILTFSSLNLLSFFILFETSIIPIAFYALIKGSRERISRAIQLLWIYTVIGSFLLLSSLFFIFNKIGTLDYITVIDHFWNYNLFSDVEKTMLLFCFFVAFAVKMPLIPFHSWLPEAHVEAPTTSSMLLAAIYLKFGGYGFIQFVLPNFLDVMLPFNYFFISIGIISIIYPALLASTSIDLKRIAAYSSISHMGIAFLGFISVSIDNTGGNLKGSFILLISHGLIAAAQFFLIGCLYKRHKTRLIHYYGGLVRLYPVFTLFQFFITICNISFPGTSSFLSEFFVFQSIMYYYPNLSIFLLISVILNTFYGFFFFLRICYGSLNSKYISFKNDLTKKETFILISYSFFIILIGLYSNFFIELISKDCAAIIFKLIENNSYTMNDLLTEIHIKFLGDFVIVNLPDMSLEFVIKNNDAIVSIKQEMNNIINNSVDKSTANKNISKIIMYYLISNNMEIFINN